MAKYKKEIAALSIGILFFVVMWSISYVVEQEIQETKAIRAKEIQVALSEKKSSAVEISVKELTVVPKNPIVIELKNTPKEESKEEIKESISEVKEVEIVEAVDEQIIVEDNNKEDIVEYTPDSFVSYVVSVKIDLKESTDVKQAISDVKKACLIMGTSPLVEKTEVISVQGRLCDVEGREQIFELDMEDK